MLSLVTSATTKITNTNDRINSNVKYCVDFLGQRKQIRKNICFYQFHETSENDYFTKYSNYKEYYSDVDQKTITQIDTNKKLFYCKDKKGNVFSRKKSLFTSCNHMKEISYAEYQRGNQDTQVATSNTNNKKKSKLELKAKNGDSYSQSMMGYNYQYGKDGFPVDLIKSFYWYKLSANQGRAYSQVKVGFFYSQGLGGLDVDRKEALYWYKLSAAQGNAFAQNNLGVFYENGWGGLPVNYEEALRLYKLSAAQKKSEKHNENLKDLEKKFSKN